MRYLNITFPDPQANLALDEALLLEAEKERASEVLRVWELTRPAVVLGSACKLAEDVWEDRCLEDGVPILRRSSGGGTVLLGEGCLLYSLVLRYQRHPALTDILSSYVFILNIVARALSLPGVPIRAAGTSDLAFASNEGTFSQESPLRKFSGNAQQRKRHHLLHHGTIMYAFDLELIEYYLHHPARQPEYRADREHTQFVNNIPLSRSEVLIRLQEAWSAFDPPPELPLEEVQQLVQTKYARTPWVRRR